MNTKRKRIGVKITVFPYGINNGLGDIFIKEDICVLVGSKFPT